MRKILLATVLLLPTAAIAQNNSNGNIGGWHVQTGPNGANSPRAAALSAAAATTGASTASGFGGSASASNGDNTYYSAPGMAASNAWQCSKSNSVSALFAGITWAVESEICEEAFLRHEREKCGGNAVCIAMIESRREWKAMHERAMAHLRATVTSVALLPPPEAATTNTITQAPSCMERFGYRLSAAEAARVRCQ